MNTNRRVTIVMYHYVRDLTRSRFPAIKGLSLDRFRRQLDHIKTHFTPITVEDLRAAVVSREMELPSNAVLLTFDDGYADHFANVFPLLDAQGIQGCFFPSAQAILQHRVLDVNKIQFVLASGSDADQLLDWVMNAVRKADPDFHLKSKEAYIQKLGAGHRYDSREVAALKLLLQRELPEPVRHALIGSLFTKYVTSDEAAFSCELYMSMDQITCLRRQGMHIGCHGFAHSWLGHLSPEEQAVEIDQSLEFLKIIGLGRDEWTMCYPFGSFNDSLLQLLRDRQCQLGFTVETRVADLEVDDRLTLPRLDTNDLPS
jgi:peptidoglycan/xylan/chitin deacetylase (PgdA/CDA1 family)